MKGQEDVVETIKQKNRHIYINKLGIDLDKIQESLLMSLVNAIKFLYTEVIQGLNLDEKSVQNKLSPIRDLRSFFKNYKSKIEELLNDCIMQISNKLESIEEIDYNELLNFEKEQIINNIENYYLENIDKLILSFLEKDKSLNAEWLNYFFKSYLYDKFTKRVKDILTSSFLIILNGQQEGLQRYESLNEKTINNMK